MADDIWQLAKISAWQQTEQPQIMASAAMAYQHQQHHQA